MEINIKIVGLGEGGAKAISKMIAAGVGKDKPVEFIAIGNDENIMLNSTARKNIFLNRDLTTIYKSIARREVDFYRSGACLQCGTGGSSDYYFLREKFQCRDRCFCL